MVMAVEQDGDRTVVTTTDIRLPQRIAGALHDSHRGEFKVGYGHEDYVPYVPGGKWQR